MHKNKVTLIAMAMTALSFTGWAGGLEIGDAMPETDTEMKNVDGEMLALEDIAGEKGTLVIFSCRHCPVVQAVQNRMVALGNEYKDKGVGVVFINSNDPSKYSQDSFASMQQQAKEKGYKFPYVVDATSGVAKSFGAKRTPEAFLFDADKRLVYHGTIDDSPRKPKQVEKQYLRDALDALLAGKQIPVQKSRAIGCGIKFRK